MNTRAHVFMASRRERERLLLCGGRVRVCLCVYVSQSSWSDSGSPLRRAHRVSEEEREVKSQSRALQEVFGTETRVKIHS